VRTRPPGRFENRDLMALVLQIARTASTQQFKLSHYLEPTNNVSERALRLFVLIRKITSGNRSAKGTIMGA
jgi:Transposase IS66 family